MPHTPPLLQHAHPLPLLQWELLQWKGAPLGRERLDCYLATTDSTHLPCARHCLQPPVQQSKAKRARKGTHKVLNMHLEEGVLRDYPEPESK